LDRLPSIRHHDRHRVWSFIQKQGGEIGFHELEWASPLTRTNGLAPALRLGKATRLEKEGRLLDTDARALDLAPEPIAIN
jgi:hypothetical protein